MSLSRARAKTALCVEDLQSVWICISGAMTARISAMLMIIGNVVGEEDKHENLD